MFTDFFKGVTAYGRAFTLISEMKLWKYLLAPGIISVLLAAIIGLSAFQLSDNLGSLFISWYPFEWGLDFLTKASSWLGGILVALFGLIIYKHLVMVAVSPFMSPLSEKVEEQLTGNHTLNKGFRAGRAIKELIRGLRVAIRNIIREIFFVALLMLLGFIPAVAIFSSVLIFIIQAYYAGFGNLDYTLERHFSVKESVRFVSDHKGLAIGNGAVFLGLLMTGIGFLFAPPLATIAGTIESVKAMKYEGILPEVHEDLV